VSDDSYRQGRYSTPPDANTDPNEYQRGQNERMRIEKQRADAAAAEQRQRENEHRQRDFERGLIEAARRRNRETGPWPSPERSSRHRVDPPPPPGPPRPPPEPPLTLGDFVAALGVLPLLVGLLAGVVAVFLGDDYARVALIAGEITVVTIVAVAVVDGVDEIQGLLIVVVGVWLLLHWRGYVGWLPPYYW
jgi:hypothetical protein